MKGYKTVIANLIVILGGVLAMLGADVPQETLQDAGGAVIALIGAGNIILRAITNTPIFNRGPKPQAKE